MTTAETEMLAEHRAEIDRLRERVESLEATIEVLSNPDLLRQLAESRAEVERGEPTYSLEDVAAERARHREAS